MTATDLYNDLISHGFSLLVQGGNLILSPSSLLSQSQRLEVKQHKNELLLLLAANDHYPKGAVESNPFNLDKYAHMVKCQQCEYLSLTGQCTRKQGIKPIPDALRTCDKFNLLKTERINIQGQRYTTSEINSLVERYEKPLFYHALDCPTCHIQKARYCANGYAIGSVYDALLLVCEDAQARREDLALRIDKACISGRSVFEAFNPANVPPPPKIEPITRKHGHTPDYEAFINHWTACKVCKPNLGRYCIEGQKLKEVARA